MFEICSLFAYGCWLFGLFVVVFCLVFCFFVIVFCFVFLFFCLGGGGGGGGVFSFHFCFLFSLFCFLVSRNVARSELVSAVSCWVLHTRNVARDTKNERVLMEPTKLGLS